MLSIATAVFTNRYLLKACGFILISVLGLALHFAKETPPKLLHTTSQVTITPIPSQQSITIHISGAVRYPGVYTLPPQSRLHDALKIAGNHLHTADLSSLNLASPLKDGHKVLIPHLKPKVTGKQTQKSTNSFNRVSINTSSIKDLDTLPGIGPSLAKRIVKYRETHGKFQTLNDLTKVSGIGPTQLRKLKHLIYL